MSIKKAELHVHLEGTIRPGLFKQLAARNQYPIPQGVITQDEESYTYSDFLNFLKVYDMIAGVIKKPVDYYDLTFDYLKTNALEDTIYVEMTYSPDHAEQSSGLPSNEHLAAIQQAIDEAEKKFNIVGKIIITGVRHYGVESVVSVAKQAIKKSFPCVVGFNLAGDEVNFPPHLFKKAFEIAADGGLFCTVHAGEFGPAKTMDEVINSLPIHRIGHGVQAIHSPQTIELLKEKNIPLEICPSSNITLGLFKDLAHHPVQQLLKAGVKLSLNSDDPPYFRTNLAKEYQRVQQGFGYSDEQMNQFTLMAIDAAFADETTKARLRRRVV